MLYSLTYVEIRYAKNLLYTEIVFFAKDINTAKKKN